MSPADIEAATKPYRDEIVKLTKMAAELQGLIAGLSRDLKDTQLSVCSLDHRSEKAEAHRDALQIDLERGRAYMRELVEMLGKKRRKKNADRLAEMEASHEFEAPATCGYEPCDGGPCEYEEEHAVRESRKWDR